MVDFPITACRLFREVPALIKSKTVLKLISKRFADFCTLTYTYIGSLFLEVAFLINVFFCSFTVQKKYTRIVSTSIYPLDTLNTVFSKRKEGGYFYCR